MPIFSPHKALMKCMMLTFQVVHDFKYVLGKPEGLDELGKDLKAFTDAVESTMGSKEEVCIVDFLKCKLQL